MPGGLCFFATPRGHWDKCSWTSGFNSSVRSAVGLSGERNRRRLALGLAARGLTFAAGCVVVLVEQRRNAIESAHLGRLLIARVYNDSIIIATVQ